MGRTARKRPWLAALLAFVYPGLGHVYLREWARALLWFGLFVTTGSLLVQPEVIPEAVSLETIAATYQQISLETQLALVVVTGLSMADAYWMATRSNERASTGPDATRCPNCGREVDADLDFCHWCSTELAADEEPAEESPAADRPDSG